MCASPQFVLRYHQNEILATVVNEYTDWERPVQHPINIRDETMEALGDAQVVAPLVRTGDFHSVSRPTNSFFYVFDYQTKFGDFPQVRGKCSLPDCVGATALGHSLCIHHVPGFIWVSINVLFYICAVRRARDSFWILLLCGAKSWCAGFGVLCGRVDAENEGLQSFCQRSRLVSLLQFTSESTMRCFNFSAHLRRSWCSDLYFFSIGCKPSHSLVFTKLNLPERITSLNAHVKINRAKYLGLRKLKWSWICLSKHYLRLFVTRKLIFWQLRKTREWCIWLSHILTDIFSFPFPLLVYSICFQAARVYICIQRMRCWYYYSPKH